MIRGIGKGGREALKRLQGAEPRQRSMGIRDDVSDGAATTLQLWVKRVAWMRLLLRKLEFQETFKQLEKQEKRTRKVANRSAQEFMF